MLLWALLGCMACGDDGLAVRDEGEMIVRAGGSGDALFVSFPPVGRASNADSTPGIEVENGGTAPVTITSIETTLDETGYISLKSVLPETPYKIDPEGQLRLVFRLAIPSDADAPPLKCATPADPDKLPDGISADQYCGEITFRTNARQGVQAATVYLLSGQRGGTIQVSPNVLNFAAPQIGREQSQDFTITNTGAGPLKIDEIYKSDFTNGTDDQFRVDGFPWPQVVEAGGSLVYQVRFTPEQVEEAQGKILIKSDDASSPLSTVTVRTGGGDLPQIELDPTSLSFPQGAGIKTFNITNLGTGAALLLSNMSVTPADAVDSYTVGVMEGEACTPLAQGSAQTITRQNSKTFCVEHTPTPGARTTAKVEIRSNASNVSGGLSTLDLSAGATEPDGRLEPGNIIFDAEPGDTVSREFVIHNEGQAPLMFTGYELQGQLDANEISLSPDPSGLSVAPGALQAFTLTYAREVGDLGLDQGAVVFTSNNPVELIINVRNNVQAEAFAPVATLTQSPDNPVTVGTAVTVDGSTSSAESGEIQFYTWTLLERPGASQAALPSTEASSVTFTPDVAGRYRVQLVVTSTLDLEGAAVREITVVE